MIYGRTYHVQHGATNTTMASGVGFTPKTTINSRVVLRRHASCYVCRVGTPEDVVAKFARKAVVRGRNDTPVGGQMQGDVSKGPVLDAVATFAAETRLWVEHDRVGDVVAVIGIPHLVPVGLRARVIALGAEQCLVRVHKVAMPREKGTLVVGRLALAVYVPDLCGNKNKHRTYNAVDKVGLCNMSI